jgi:hypothetical protein
MQNAGVPWPPGVGDPVWVTESGLLGRVVTVEDDAEGQRFIVNVLARSPTRHAYRLSDLDPAPWPSTHAGREEA